MVWFGKKKVIFFLIVCMIYSKIYGSDIKNTQQKGFGHDILLIINYNRAWYDSIPFLKKIYGSFFPNIVFCGPEKDSRVEFCDHYYGWFSYKAITHAMQKYPQYRGYLFLHDDCLLNFWNLARFSKDKIWKIPNFFVDKGNTTWYWWQQPSGKRAYEKVYIELAEKYKTTLEKNYGDKVVGGFSDMVYIPSKFKQDVKQLCDLFEKHSLFLEIAIPTLCACLEDKANSEIIQGKALWNSDRNKDPRIFYNTSLDFLHPLKFGSSPDLMQFVEQQFNTILS